MKLNLVAAALCFVPAIFAAVSTSAESPIRFRDVSGKSGITFRHTDGGSGKRYLMEVIGAGVATFDYDGDGRIDIYLLNGSPLRGTTTDGTPRNGLYRNVGDWRFVDATAEAGLGDPGFGLGVAVADYNNDGCPDLYLNNFGQNAFYCNNGDGTFSDVTEQTGTANGRKVGAGVSFLDIEADGDLDLYCANYIKFSYENHKTSTLLGHVVYPGPLVYPAEPDNLFRNNGDGTFTDISEISGIGSHAEWGMGTVCADFDNDGDTDIFVCNDSTRNFYFVNDGTGSFTESGLLSGLAFDGEGDAQGSMGVDCADFNHDGWLDLFQTSYQRQSAVLYANLGGGLFEDATSRTGAGRGTFHQVNWGVGFLDFDNDNHDDLFFANGHIHDNIDQFDSSTSYAMRNQLLLNTGRGEFRDVSAESGDGLEVKHSSRGTAFDDFDNDGDLDAVILNLNGTPNLLKNDLQSERHWLQVRLIGSKSNRDGVGARVKVIAGGVTQTRERHSGRGYQSHYGSRLHFGLGDHDRVDEIQVRWPGGDTQTFVDLPGDRVLTVIEPNGGPGGSRTVNDPGRRPREQAGGAGG